MRNLKYLNRKQILELMLNFARENEELESQIIALQKQIKEQQLIIETFCPQINYKAKITRKTSTFDMTKLGEK